MNDMTIAEAPPGIGHNAGPATLSVEIRLFNSLVRHAGPAGPVRRVELPLGATVGDLVECLRLPPADVFLVLINGRDISPGLYGGGMFARGVEIEDGDVVAFSGPVPYSYGYGAPIV